MYDVLIVEDEIPVRDMIIKSVDWESIGLQVINGVSDGQEALEFLEEYQVDVILTDIYMPFIDGIELIRNVRKMNNYCKVVFLTGYNEVEYAKEAINLKADRYLLKPITKKELTDVLKEIKIEIDKEKEEKKNLKLLKAEYERSKIFLRQKLLNDIILGYIPEDRIEIDCKNLNFEFNSNYYSVGVIEVLNKEEVTQKYWSEDYSIFHFAIYNICKEVIQKESKYHIILGESGKVIVLFYGDNKKDCEKVAYTLLNEAIYMLRHIYSVPVSAGFGECYEELKDINYSYKEAISAINYRVLEGLNRVIVNSDIDRKPTKNLEKVHEYSNKIEGFMKVNNIVGIKRYIILFFEHIKFHKMELNEVKTVILSLVTRIYESFNELSIYDNEKLVIDFKLIDKIYHMDNLDNIKYDIEQICNMLSTKLNSARENEKNNIVLNALKIIERDFQEPDLDLNTMSEKLHVSTSYFSRTFKKIRGETFVEYLTNYRMDKAKELLKTTNMKVYEISQSIGYDDSHYFSYNFRKNVGLTPSQYRKGL